MLGFLFGFNARLGRMHFFLATVALAVVMTAICFAIVMQYAHSNPSGALPSKGLMTWPLIAAAAFFGWMTFTLQCMRIRDIGWDPVCVIPAWIAILIVDQLVAGKIPAWSLGHNHSGTIIGAATNLFLMLALMFWPSGDYAGPTSTFGDTPGGPDRPATRTDQVSAYTARASRASGAEFGRRTS